MPIAVFKPLFIAEQGQNGWFGWMPHKYGCMYHKNMRYWTRIFPPLFREEMFLAKHVAVVFLITGKPICVCDIFLLRRRP